MENWVKVLIVFIVLGIIFTVLILGIFFTQKEEEGTPAVGCKSISDCPANNLCRDNVCVPVSRCEQNKDCLSGQICDGGICVTPAVGPGGCVANSECDEGERCGVGRCVPFVEDGIPFYLNSQLYGFVRSCEGGPGVSPGAAVLGASSLADGATIFTVKTVIDGDIKYFNFFDSLGRIMGSYLPTSFSVQMVPISQQGSVITKFKVYMNDDGTLIIVAKGNVEVPLSIRTEVNSCGQVTAVTRNNYTPGTEIFSYDFA